MLTSRGQRALRFLKTTHRRIRCRISFDTGRRLETVALYFFRLTVVVCERGFLTPSDGAFSAGAAHHYLRGRAGHTVCIYINPLCTLTAQREEAKFLLSSRPQTGIRSPPISGPRPSFLGRSRCGSHPPASAGPIPVRTLSGSGAAAEHSDPELRSFKILLDLEETGTSKKLFAGQVKPHGWGREMVCTPWGT